MDNISIVKCNDYDITNVKNAIKQAVGHLGGISSFVNPGESVLLKVNLLMKRKPEKVTTTHPALAQALAELVIEAGGHPIIGDSPGGYHFYTKNSLDAVYETCGMKDAAKKSGAKLNYNTDIVDIPYPEGVIVKNIKATQYVMNVDKIINIPKIKTHGMTVYSGAVKNLFGIVPGSYKAEYHLRFEDTSIFADLLIDLCLFAKPVLTVMDAIIGMEGYGPSNGKPKEVGLIIAGENPFALDVVAASIINLKPKQVPTIIKSAQRKLCSIDLKDLNLLGEKIEDVIITDFQIPTKKINFNFYNLFLPKIITKKLNNFIKATPQINKEKCKGCKICAESCPPKVITMQNNIATINYDKCIRCFCCHELCKYDAIRIKRPWFLRLLLK